MLLEVAKTLMYVSTFSVGVPLLLLLLRREVIKQKYFTLLGLLFLISFGADITSLFVIIGHIHNSTAFLVNAQDILQFVLLLLIYREFYLSEKKIALALIVITYFGFEIINSIFLQKFINLQTWTWSLQGVIFIGVAIGYFSYLLRNLPTTEITRFAPGWINIANLFYFSFSLSLFLMAEFVFKNISSNNAIIFWGFHNLNNIVKNCLFAIGIYLGKEK